MARSGAPHQDTESTTIQGQVAHRTPAWLAGLPGLVALLSLARPLSFDEMYWLTIARRMFGAGDLPYFDLLDNKGPILYFVLGAADVVPLGTRAGLSVLLTAVAVALAIGVARLAEVRGQSEKRWQIYSAAAVVWTALALSVWSFTTELLAATAIVWALAARRPWWKIALLVTACGVDPRALLLVPVVLAEGYRSDILRRKHLSAFLAAVLLAAAVVVSVPALRYAFIETSLSTRFDFYPIDLALIGVAALAPLGAVLTLRRRAVPIAAWWLLAGAVLVGLTAGLPFGHYWIYVVLLIPLISITGRRWSVAGTAVLNTTALAVLVVAVSTHLVHDIDQANRYEPTAIAIADFVGPSDRVLVLSGSPHLRYRIGAQTLGFAPTSNYLGWGLPHSEMLLERFGAAVTAATVIVVDPELSDYRGFPDIARALDLASTRVSDAVCSQSIGQVMAYRFTDC